MTMLFYKCTQQGRTQGGCLCCVHPPFWKKGGAAHPPFFRTPFSFSHPPPFFAALRTLTMCPHELIFYHKLPTIGTMFGTIFLFIEGSNCLLLRNFCFFNFKPLFSEFSAQIKLFRFHCLSLCPAIRISVRCDRWLFLLK